MEQIPKPDCELETDLPTQSEILETPLTEEEIRRKEKLFKKKQRANEMKLNKKLSQGFKTLTKNEQRPVEELITEEPTDTLVVLHFGLGCEDDYSTLTQFLKDKGSYKLEIHAGYPYGTVKFGSQSEAEIFIQSVTQKLGDKVANSVELNYGGKVRNTFFFYTNSRRLL